MNKTTVRRVLATKGYELYTVGGEEPALAALEQMAVRNIGALLVLVGGDLVGVVTERDCARNLELLGRTAQSTRVEEIMDRDLVTVSSETTLEECLRIMTEKRVRHLPVIDDGLIGLISIGDVGKSLISEQGQVIEDLTSFITGSPR